MGATEKKQLRGASILRELSGLIRGMVGLGVDAGGEQGAGGAEDEAGEGTGQDRHGVSERWASGSFTPSAEGRRNREDVGKP
jgi:hypothetical protein